MDRISADKWEEQEKKNYLTLNIGEQTFPIRKAEWGEKD